jgi:hypothetical protein
VNWKIRKMKTAIKAPRVIDSEMVVKGSIPPVFQRTAMDRVWGTKPAKALNKPTRKSFSYRAISPKI